jgi:hypothetical protein
MPTTWRPPNAANARTEPPEAEKGESPGVELEPVKPTHKVVATMAATARASA